MGTVTSTQSIIDSRSSKEFKQSSIDNRVKSIHEQLCKQLRDSNYDIGHTYKISKFSEKEIYDLAEWCARKANTPGKAFVSIFEKKLARGV
jgi:hypothetical protein